MRDKNFIFKFWKRIGLSEKIHPADRDVFKQVGKRGHKLHLSCLPSPILGRLKDAPVVFLFLSPGFNEKDLKDAKTLEGRKKYRKRRAGLLEIARNGSAGDWLKKIAKPFRLDEDTAFKKIAILNIGAYHSKYFHDYPLLAALPSSRVSLDWAQTILFPQAKKGERVVICLRSAHFWGLETGTAFGKLFVPEVTRGGHMKGKTRKQKKMKAKVIRAVRKALL